jgi:diaminopimelate epimerase
MTLRFFKGHGLGNDYLVVDARGAAPPAPEQVRRLCDRHRGVGADGVLAVIEPHGADVGVRIFNPDGSEAEKSGNGLRILGLYLVTRQGFADRFTVDTLGGRVTIAVDLGGAAPMVTVDMGTASFPGPTGEALRIGDEELAIDAVSIGNPHCVILRDALDEAEARRLGPLVEAHPRFPARTNVQLVRPLGRDRIAILIWERGAGYTLASGSSSCAAAAACLRRGLVDRAVTVEMPGGELEVAIDEAWQVRLRGPAEAICDGDAV